jgi:hypothetical protein
MDVKTSFSLDFCGLYVMFSFSLKGLAALYVEFVLLQHTFLSKISAECEAKQGKTVEMLGCQRYSCDA